MADVDWQAHEFFSRNEFLCGHGTKCSCGRADMDPDFIKDLEYLRVVFDKPMRISSGFRCPDYNETISSSGRMGPHTTGKAADILVHGTDALALLEIILFIGDWTGIGINQKGPINSRFIHVDQLEPGQMYPRRPWLWSY